jgi:hypothetical protein
MTIWIRLAALALPFVAGFVIASHHYRMQLKQINADNATAYAALKRSCDAQNAAIVTLQRQAQSRAAAAASAIKAANLAAQTKLDRATVMLDSQPESGDRCASASALIDRAMRDDGKDRKDKR